MAIAEAQSEDSQQISAPVSLTAKTMQPQPAALIETPPYGIYHPVAFSEFGYMDNPQRYVQWYERMHPWVTEATPRVGVLLYRKHVVTEQGYIPNIITLMESQGIMPIPIFITG